MALASISPAPTPLLPIVFLNLCCTTLIPPTCPIPILSCLWAINLCLSPFPAFIWSVHWPTLGQLGLWADSLVEERRGWMRAKAFRQGGGELKHHGAGIGSCICKSLNHGIISPPFSLAYFSLEPVFFSPPQPDPSPNRLLTSVWKWVPNEVLARDSDRQYVSVCVCVRVCFGLYKSVIAGCFLDAGTPVPISLSLYKVVVTCKHTTSWHWTLKGVYVIENSSLRC